MYRPQKFTDFAFEGILLDINQQAKMDSLNAIYQPNGKIGEKCNLQDKKLDKQDKNLNKKDCCKDKDSLKQSGKQCAGKQDRMENRRKYVEGVKEIASSCCARKTQMILHNLYTLQLRRPYRWRNCFFIPSVDCIT